MRAAYALALALAPLGCNDHPLRDVSGGVSDPAPCRLAGPPLTEAPSSSLCLEVCAADLDPATALVDVDCRVVVVGEGGYEALLPPCVDVDGAPTPPPDEPLCVVLRSDDGELTATPLDDLSQACVDAGWNIEVEVIRAGPPQGDAIEVMCRLADDPSLCAAGAVEATCL